jgi:hypothetical protein
MKRVHKSELKRLGNFAAARAQLSPQLGKRKSWGKRLPRQPHSKGFAIFKFFKTINFYLQSLHLNPLSLSLTSSTRFQACG